jgi:flagellar basal body rod protein FlgF
MVKKKKVTKKIGAKKLEDRIAPGMVGGGLVDPGMVDAVEIDSDQQQDQNTGEVEGSQAEHLPEGEAPEGQYLDEAGSGENYDSEGQEGAEGDTESEQEDLQQDQDYDEFSNNDATAGDYVEEPGAWQEPDWVSGNADGSFSINPPEGVSIDEGMANFSVEAANTELPLPDGAEIQTDGSMNIPLPEGAEYLEDSNQLLLPAGEVDIQEIPEDMNAYQTPQGDIMMSLPDDGFDYDAESNTLNVDNYHLNEMAPENVEFNGDGSVSVDLPDEGIEYNDDGSLQVSAEAANFMDEPPAEYYGDMDCVDCQADGSLNITPPEGVEVDGGVATMDWEVANAELPLEDDFTINADGTSEFGLPEGADYNPDINGITFPEGEINLDEVPEGIDAHLNPDGTSTVMLGDGMEYNGDANVVHFDNYWTNEITPDQMEVTADGQINVALPEGTEYFEDGSFQIPSEHAEFMEQPAPDYVADVEWSEPLADGGFQFEAPEDFNLNVDEGVVEMPHDAFMEHCPIDENLQFNSDGTMDVSLPEGTTFDAASNSLTLPEGDNSVAEIPEQVNPTLNEDGTISVTLQDGMEFNADTGAVHMDNYWTNELTPEPVEFGDDGSVAINLPEGTEFGGEGEFTIPEYSADFLENPDPSYLAEGPDWIEGQPDGSVYVQNFDAIDVNPEEHQCSMEGEYFNEQFDNHIPDEVQFNGDGTMDVQVPEGTTFDAEANSLTFASGEVHLDEIPNEMNASLNADGSITVGLNDGMEFNADTGAVHMDNYWTNELTPDAVEFDPSGQVNVDLPHDTHFYDDGSFQVPEDSADFCDHPHPEYVEQGPDWVNDNPDGSVTVEAPEGITVDTEAGTLTMDAETAMQELGGDLIPEEITINADGTANIQLPEGTSFDADANALTFAPGEFHPGEAPEGMDAQVNDDGSVTLSLSEGATFDADTNSVQLSNEIINEMAPGPINITVDGQFQIELPEDTQYFEGNSFVISSESADFLDDGDHGEHHHNEGQEYQQAS